MAKSASKEIKAIEKLNSDLAKVRSHVKEIIFGQDEVIDKIIITLLSGGHTLLVGLPGLAKTRLVRSLGTIMGLSRKRIQFTPDLMPTDILGSEILEESSKGKRSFKFLEGPVFSQFLLADEINRASPRTQSALLQAMQERRVTVGGKNYDLPEPFHVLATQNPIEQEGTYPLPEAQVDRFMLKTVIDYPKIDEEQIIVRSNLYNKQEKIKAVVTTKQVETAQATVREIYMDEKIEKYILDLIFATRYPENYNLLKIKPLISFGASPRGSINLATAAKCHAFLKHRGYVIPEDVRAVIYDVLRHRIGLTYEAEAENVTTEDLISQIINEVEVP